MKTTKPAQAETTPRSTIAAPLDGVSETFQDPATSRTVHAVATTREAPFDAVLSRTESAVSNVLSTETFRTVMAQVRNGDYADEVAEVRKLYIAGGKTATRTSKSRLPAVTFSGYFKTLKGQAPSPHSGLIVADFDELGDDILIARSKLVADPHVIGLFLSPTGSGLKAIFRCNPNREHVESFSDLIHHCQEIHGLTADASGRNVNRLCFLSHDPEAVVRDQARELPQRNSCPEQAKPIPTNLVRPPLANVTLEEAATTVNRIPADCDRNTWIRVGMGLKHEFDDDGYRLWDSWSKSCMEKYPGPTETKVQWGSFNNHPPGKVPVTYATIRHLASPEEIVLPGANTSITTCAKKLFAAIAPREKIFVRGGCLQELVKREGSIILRVITADAFQSRIEDYGRVVKRDKKTGELVSAICSRQTAAALMQSDEADRQLPAIDLLSKCAIFTKTPTGAEVLGEGWHPQRVYVTEGGTPPQVEIGQAIRSLKSILSDFDFATPSDRTRALAALISPAMNFGGWIDRHPIIIVMADDSQAGKGYLLQCIASIYRETPCIVTQRGGGVGSMDESINQKLIDGRPFIQIDNWRGALS